MPQQDFRARLSPKNIEKATTILGTRGSDNLLNPLFATGGVLFPYTPTVTTGSVAEYDSTPFTHSIYGYNAYIRSYPKTINVTAEFTAQTTDEALYLLAVLHFFRSVTKSYFGVQPYNRAGTPPPVLLFSYLGEYMFNDVPVIVKSFDYSLPGTVQYVAVNTAGIADAAQPGTVALPGSNAGWTRVPTNLIVTIELDTQYIPIKLRNEFNLDDFRSGKLIGKGFI